RTPSPHSEASDLHHTASHSFPTRRSSDLPQWNCTFCWQGHDYTAAVELVIHVPRQINVKLESYKPDIKIAGIQGDIRVKSYKSPIELDSTTGAVRIDTYKDSVKLRNVNLRGPLEIKSYKADAEIDARSLADAVT